MNSLKIAAALRVLALAFEAPEDGALEQPAPTQPAAEKPKRGRGRPVVGEETAPAAVTAAATASVATAVTAPGAGAATISPSDPFETSPTAPPATLEEVRTALKALAAAVDQATALGILKTAGGAANLTDLKSEKYGTVVQAATAALPPIKTEPTPVEVDPFEVPAATPTTAPEAKPVTLEEVKGLIVATQKRTSTDAVQKVVMDHGGKASVAGGGVQPSLKALPPEQYAATIAALKALPTTK